MSTKSQSYIQSKSIASDLHVLILKTLKEEPALSRSQLANRTGIKLSSVCARVRELLDAGEVVVRGTTWDSDTERNVQTISIKAGA